MFNMQALMAIHTSKLSERLSSNRSSIKQDYYLLTTWELYELKSEVDFTRIM